MSKVTNILYKLLTDIHTLKATAVALPGYYCNKGQGVAVYSNEYCYVLSAGRMCVVGEFEPSLTHYPWYADTEIFEFLQNIKPVYSGIFTGNVVTWTILDRIGLRKKNH